MGGLLKMWFSVPPNKELAIFGNAPVQDINFFEKELAALISKPSSLRPFVCEGSPLECKVFIVPPLPAKLSALSDQKLTLGDAWLEVFQQVLPRNQFCAAGKLVARAYREEFGEEPPRRQQFVDGAPRQVKSYRRSWLIGTLKRFRAQLTGG